MGYPFILSSGLQPCGQRPGAASRRRWRGLAMALPFAAAIGAVPDRAKAAGMVYAVPHPGDTAGPTPAIHALAPDPGARARAETARRRRAEATRVEVRPPVPGAPGGASAPRPAGPVADRWESLLAACTGGMVLRGTSAAATAEATTIAIGAGLVLPAMDGAVVLAAAMGCGISMASTAVSLGSVAVWRRATR